jgi:membrane protease YdiL (CAAX protease family)
MPAFGIVSSDENAAQTSDDRFAEKLRGFGPIGIAAIVVILAANLITVPLSAVLVIAWVGMSRTPWRDIGFVRVKNWAGIVAVGVAIGVAFKLLLKIVVMPLLGADPINHTYHYLVGNPAALPAILATVIVAGGFCEETVFRGYMFERLGKLMGNGPVVKIVSVVVTTALFALGHFRDQGFSGVEQAVITGSVFGTIYAVTGRIWMLMIAHAAFDIAAIAIIYWNLEGELAHLIFK